MEDLFAQCGVFDTRGAVDIAEFEPARAGGNDLPRRRARHGTEIQALAFVELPGHTLGHTTCTLTALPSRSALSGWDM